MYSRIGDAVTAESRTGVTPSAADGLEDVLDDPHCRYLLEYLEREDGAVSEATLARHVVARITETSPGAVADGVQRRVQIWLHHGQLPVLDDYGVVEFDAATGTVSLGRDDG